MKLKTNKNRLLMLESLVAFILLITGINSCNVFDGDQNSSSEVTTLENFSGMDNKFLVNECGDEKKAVPTFEMFKNSITLSDTSASISKAVGQSLNAVPSVLRDTYFKELGGTISVVAKDQANSECSGHLQGSEESFFKEVSGDSKGHFSVCWKRPDGNKGPVIFIESNPDAIKHSMIRIFAYIYTQYILGALETSAPEVSKEEFSKISDLAEKFLADLNENQNKFAAAKFINTLDKKSLANFVFAEATDSFYCKKESAESFIQNFNKTYQAYIGSSKGVVDPKSFAGRLGKPWFLD